jgi:LacI family transcriptional regulator
LRGVIAVSLNPEMCEIAHKSHLPLVRFDNYHLELSDALTTSTKVAAEQSIELLEKTGCNRIAFVCKDDVLDLDDPRVESYNKWCLKHNLKPEIIGLPEVTSRLSTEYTLKHIAKVGCPDAFFCQNDYAALGVHYALTKLKINIPDEASIIGFDGIPETQLVYPEITTSIYPYDEIAKTLVDMLKYRIENPYAPYVTKEVGRYLIERGSTRKIPG